MNVADLNEEQLDYWVARAMGIDVFQAAGGGPLSYVPAPNMAPRKWNPCRFWSQGGPIIEQAKIDLNWDMEGTRMWSASMDPDVLAQGETVLEAAMRAFVTARLGEEVGQ